MNIIVAVNEIYLDYLETMLFSLSKTTGERITVHLINSELNVLQINKLKSFLIKKCEAKLNVYNFDVENITDMPIGKHFSKEIYYRIFAQYILPDNIERAL